ncbi:MAG: methyl-accepting chemotaxis protein [Chloroflexota bacterium]
MRWLNDLRLRTKLFGAFVIVCALMGVVGYAGINAAYGVQQHLSAAIEGQLPSQSHLGRTEIMLTRAQRDVRSVILVSDAKASGELQNRVKASVAAAEDEWGKFKSLPRNEAEQKLVAQYDATYKTWKDVFNQSLADAALNTPEGNAAAVDSLFNKVVPLMLDLTKSLDALNAEQVRQGREAAEAAAASLSAAVRTVVVVMGMAVVFALGAGWIISQSIVKGLEPVMRVVTSLADNCATWLGDALRAMAEGDLTREVKPVTAPIEGQRHDEIGLLAAKVNEMRDKVAGSVVAYESSRKGLQELIGNVQRTAETVAQTSQQLGDAAGQSGQAVQQVASAIQQVARGAQDQAESSSGARTTTNQMASGIEQVAANAQTVAAASQQTQASAAQGAQAVEATVGGMTEIRAVVTEAATKVEELGRLGEKIGAVVETINDIAEQTNLLALNAAIEAARAGEHGKGFAVVADEVRKLAERSQAETKEIAALIQNVQTGTDHAVRAMEQGAEKVERGSAQATEAGTALRDILEAVGNTVDQVGEIAAAAQEMAGRSRELITPMESIAAVAEQNSAATEQVSASVEEMTAQVQEMSAQAADLSSTAQRLNELVSRFRIEPEASGGRGGLRRVA